MNKYLVTTLVSLAALANTQASTVIDVGPNHRTIRNGEHVYHELATGMNYQKDGRWIPATEQIEVIPGGAAFRQGQHQVNFPHNIHDGLVDLVTSDGKRLQSSILGIALHDKTTGAAVLIGDLKSSVGELVTHNQLVYREPFDGVAADVRFTITKAGLEQDVILTGVNSNLDPAAYGMNPATTSIEILTEFISPPAPRLIAVHASTNAPVDTIIDFGAMQMRRGRAFLEGSTGAAVRISKSWQHISGRTFLVESVPLASIQKHIANLPQVAATRKSPLRVFRGSSTLAALVAGDALPGSRQLFRTTEPVLMANNAKPSEGLVFDYILLSSTSGQTLSGGTTYYVSGAVSLTGTTVIDGGAIVKYANTNGAKISLDGFADCQTAAFRPAIFTAQDDDSVGAIISGSSGTPSGYYADSALDVNTGDYASVAILHDLKVLYATIGINLINNGGGYQVRNSQVLNCDRAFGANNVNFGLQNVLIYNSTTFCDGTDPVNGYVENLTVDQCTNLVSGDGNMFFTNCAVANVANLTANNSTMTIDGSFNGFYNSSTFGNNTVSATNNPFQTVLAGAHYLAANSAFLDAGTNGINSVTAMWLLYKTTEPPQYLSSITANSTNSPVVTLDSNRPDIGYHYDPIDYLANDVSITNATMLWTNGV